MNMDDLTLRVTIGSQAWYKIGKALEASVSNMVDHEQAAEWFSSQNAKFKPQSDMSLQYYNLEFDSVEHLTEFVLKWL